MTQDQLTQDQLLSRRRVLQVGTAVVGAATVAQLFTDRPGAAPSAAPARPAPGPRGSGPLRPSSYRLQPITGYGPQRAERGRSVVRSRPFLRLDGRHRSMVLTFDDGPDPRYTPDVLRILRQYGVRAMFFVCGGMAQENTELLREMAYDGHVVGNHTWSHPLLTRLSRSQIRSELERTSDVVLRASGQWPGWFRAPYGAWNRDAYEIGAELGMEPLAWSVDTLDWRSPGPRAIVDRVTGGAAPGAIVLAHDAGGDRSGSVQALRDYLPRLLRSGYRLTVPRRSSA
ncbi:polysaccharide deacetylase family protein [Streptomyces cavernae]|uniref:polysaccharide deacetylase family protein n=1 Tax=Streptomyces cavernae TaxID=2259034 RepID=UPI00192E6736|nr:polysaccharide deacetylase family protein [Streptomyces cavernae]